MKRKRALESYDDAGEDNDSADHTPGFMATHSNYFDNEGEAVEESEGPGKKGKKKRKLKGVPFNEAASEFFSGRKKCPLCQHGLYTFGKSSMEATFSRILKNTVFFVNPETIVDNLHAALKADRDEDLKKLEKQLIKPSEVTPVFTYDDRNWLGASKSD